MSTVLISQRYARALASNITDAPRLEEVLETLQGFAQSYAELPELRRVLENPAISPASRKRVFDEIVGKIPNDRVSRNFLRTLFSRGRINLLHEVVEAFENIVDRRLKRVQAVVTSASELKPEQLERVRLGLEKQSGKSVRLNAQTDSDLLGGIVVRMGSSIIDGSLRSRLERIREALLAEENA